MPDLTELINRAARVAPLPERREDATVDVWVRYFAALALAAHAGFAEMLHEVEKLDENTPSPPGTLALLINLAVAAQSAVIALQETGEEAGAIWDLTPELGALNGEWEGYLASTLDGLGVNPADLDPRYVAADFNSPSRRPEAADA